MVACIPERKRNHFRHKRAAQDRGCTGETDLHRYVIEYIKTRVSIPVPSTAGIYSIGAVPGPLNIRRALDDRDPGFKQLTKSLGLKGVPDLLLETREGYLAVEVVVTSDVSTKKAREFLTIGLPCLRVYTSSAGNRDTLHALLKTSTCYDWVEPARLASPLASLWLRGRSVIAKWLTDRRLAAIWKPDRAGTGPVPVLTRWKHMLIEVGQKLARRLPLPPVRLPVVVHEQGELGLEDCARGPMQRDLYPAVAVARPTVQGPTAPQEQLALAFVAKEEDPVGHSKPKPPSTTPRQWMPYPRQRRAYAERWPDMSRTDRPLPLWQRHGHGRPRLH